MAAEKTNLKCPNCGADIAENTKFCGKCGSNITNIQTTQQSSKSKGKCPNCGAVALAHTVCTACGQYKGKVVSRKVEGFVEASDVFRDLAALPIGRIRPAAGTRLPVRGGRQAYSGREEDRASIRQGRKS